MALLLPQLGAIGIALTGRWPNLRESITLVVAAYTGLIVIALYYRLQQGADLSLRLAEPLPGLAWYFEIEPENRKMPVWIQQRMLFEREEGFTNRILILGQVPRRSLTLTIGRPKARLDQVQNDSSSTPPTDR